MGLDLAVIGNLLLDDVVYADGRTRMAQPGGATLYVALAARLWGVTVGIAALAGNDYPAGVLEALAARGIDLSGVERLNGPGLRTWLLYEGRRRRVVHRLDGPSHAEVSPGAEKLPRAWQPRAIHLAPMPFAVQAAQIERLAARQGTLLSLDPYELLEEDRLDVWRDLVARTDLLFLSEDEMSIGGGLGEPQPVLERLASGRLQAVVYKRGERGGVLWDARRGRLLEWRPRLGRVVDATGAGDAFAGGFLAGTLRGDDLPRRLQLGVVSASFALAGEGADALLAADPQTAETRRQEWFGA